MRTMHRVRAGGVLILMIVTGCDFEYDDPIPPDPDPDHPVVTTLARPCIRAFAAGELAPSDPEEIFLTYVCDGGAIIEDVRVDGGALVGANARADFQDRAIRVIKGDLDGAWPDDVINVNEHSPGGWAFMRAAWGGPSGYNLAFERPFSDIAITNIDGNTTPDLVLAGDQAIRHVEMVRTWPPLSGETELLTGKPFRYVAVAELGGDDKPDLFYVASTPGQPVELGTALQTSAMTFTVQSTSTQPAGEPLPLVVADVDGDKVPDVIGATPALFVQSSRFGALVVSTETAAALAAGDVDGDGHPEVVFVTGDKTAVRTARVDSLGGTAMLKAAPLLSDGGDAIGVANLDGDAFADVVLAKEIGQPSSTLVLHLAHTY
jgi:hypothetical protein